MNDLQIRRITALRNSYDDATPEHFILNTLLLALETGCVDELEEAITPLVDRWLAESMGIEDTLGAYRETVL